jgi:uncharacterized protein YcaQ
VKVAADQARRFLVARQQLSPARSLPAGPDGVLAVFRRLGSVQFDPIAVAGRSHDLVLHARVADYRPAWIDEMYARREIFEAYNKGLSFLPMGDLPFFATSIYSQPAQQLEENADVAARVLERIRAEGPLSALDFERERGTTADWFGLPMNAVKVALDAYTWTGELGLARRDGARRFYDLRERLVPADVLAREIPLHEQLRFRMLSRYRAHGLLGGSSSGDVFNGLGPAKPDRGLPGRTPLREELIEAGEIVGVEVEGVRGQRFVLADEVALLEAPPEPAPTVAFLSPFDAFVWDRKLLGSLFEFEYVWELFHPPARRRWGWYVLPILFGDRLVGRIEPRIEEGSVRILNVWWEDGFVARREEGFVEAMRDALGAYLRFADAGRIVWPAALRSEERTFAVSSATVRRSLSE